MQGKGLVKVFLVLIIAVCLLQFAYFIPTNNVENAADAYAEKLHRESMQYASDVFAYLEENLHKTLQAVHDNGNALRGHEDDNSDRQ